MAYNIEFIEAFSFILIQKTTKFQHSKDKQYKRSLAIYIVSIYKVRRGWLFIYYAGYLVVPLNR